MKTIHDDLLLHPKTCEFICAKTETEYIAFAVDASLNRVYTYVRVSVNFWLIFLVLGCGMAFTKNPPDLLDIGGIIACFLSAILALVCLKCSWIRQSNNCEVVVVCYIIAQVLALSFVSLEFTYDYSFEKCWGLAENDCDYLDSVSKWMELSMIFGQFPLILFICTNYVEVVRGRGTQTIIFCTVVGSFVRCMFLTPLPSNFLPAFVGINYVGLPYLLIRLSRTQERSKRAVFLLQHELKLNNRELERKLNDAEKALAFEQPTAKEQAVVAAALDGLQSDTLDIQFDDLEFHERIGAGAFGEVIKATYKDSFVAVKRLLRNRIDEQHIAMFREEIMLLRNLRHPNIVQFVGASWNSVANICIVFEYVERGSLRDVLNDTHLKLTWEDPKLKMVMDSVSGAAYLHHHNPPIIHRDIKAENVLVTTTFLCKLTDFGASKESTMDRTMTVVGTARYMAPEIIRSGRYTVKVDVFALGMLIYEIDSRERPFEQDNLTGNEVLVSVLQGVRPKLSPEMPSELRQLVTDCWAEDPDKRPSCVSLLSRLKDIQYEILAVSRTNSFDVATTAPAAAATVVTTTTTAAAAGAVVSSPEYYDEEDSLIHHRRLQLSPPLVAGGAQQG